MMLFRKTCLAASLVLSALGSLGAMASPVLQNGGFEDNAPSSFGNNLDHDVSPWVLTDRSNVVRVDGPNGSNYGSNGPESDARAPGEGVFQHYLDIADAGRPFYQEFVPQCTGDVIFGGYFSTRGNQSGNASVSIQDAGGADLFGPFTVSLTGGNSQFDPWVLNTFTANLTAGTTYRFHVYMGNNLNFDEAFVNFTTKCDEHDVVEVGPRISVEKTCEPSVDAGSNVNATCTVNVDYDGDSLNVTSVSFSDNLTIDGSQSNTATTAIDPTATSEEWACVHGADSDPVTCAWTDAATQAPPTGQHGSEFSANLDLPPVADGWESAENCVQATLSLVNGNSEDAFTITSEEVCATILPPQAEETPPTGVQCNAFTPTVECGASGGYQVSLSNSLSGTFDPTSIDVTVLTGGVTAQSHPGNPLTLFLNGAKPGETVKMSLASAEHGAGSEPGLDLCCMGELEVTIPEELVCDPPEEFLDISKTCEPFEGGEALGNTLCHIAVNYSGPPPIKGVNDIVIKDDVLSGTGLVSFNGSDPTGGVGDWDCQQPAPGPSRPSNAPMECHMNTAIDPTADWTQYSSTVSLYMQTDETYKNCASASMVLPNGQELTAEDCYSRGDSELTIAKSASFDVCYPGQVCAFEYTVTNSGAGDYSDTITLLETALAPTGGTISGMSPQLCADPADLLAGGCTGPADIPAGSSITYTVSYLPPNDLLALEEGQTHEGRNCVSLDDANLGEFDIPSEENGHLACTEFEIGSPLLELEKVARGACEPGQDCLFDIIISTSGQPFAGKIALYEEMGGLSPSIVSVNPPLPSSCTVTNPLQCVLDVNLAANASYTMTVTARYSSSTNDPDHDRNCAWVAIVPDNTPSGDFDANSQTPPAWADEILYGMPEPSCVSLDPPVDDPEVAVVKTCEPAIFEDIGVPVFTVNCQIAVTSSGPLQSPYSVSDLLIGPNGQDSTKVTNIWSDDGWVCPSVVPVLSASDTLTCTIAPADFPASNQSVIHYEMVFDQADAEEEWRNCLPGPVAGTETGCVPLQFSELEVEKTCDKSEVIARSEQDRYELSCDITVRGSNLPTGAPILITDQFTTQSAPTLGVVGSSNPQFANCAPAAPTATQQAFTCEVDPAVINAAGPSGVTTTISMIVAAPMANAVNCAFGMVPGLPRTDESCHDINVVVEDSGAATPQITLSKACTALPRFGAVQQYSCVIDVMSDGTPFSGDLVIDDVMTLPGHVDPASTIVSITAPAPWQCNAAPAQCAISATDLAAAGNSGQINVIVSSLAADFGQPGALNCAIAGIPEQETTQGCHVFTPGTLPPVDRSTPELEPFKVARGECAVSKATQTYTCGFELGVRNIGTSAYVGPLVLDDTFGAPKPDSVKTLGGDGWECLRTDGLGTSCLNGSVTLDPGGSSSVAMEVIIPGLPSGGTFENCVGVGIGDSSFLRASVMQSIMQKLGIDGGPVDGSPGRKTRAGVRELQERFGLEPTGEIDNQTFAALGVPSTEDVRPSCITVNLPPMPVLERPCEPGQVKNSRGVCTWPKTDCPSGQVKNSKGQCYTPEKSCPSGQVKNSKGQCYTPRTQTPSCDSRSTVQQGNGCACRYSGMRKVNSTRCVCSNTGLPPVPGAGCPRVKIERGEGDGAAPGGQKCIVVNGIRLCS